MLRLAAKAVEESEKEDGDQRVEKRGAEEMKREQRFRLCEQDAAGQGNHSLMDDEEACGECEPRGGMFRIQARADGGSEIADHGFGDPEQS